ncbi:hypothetical protein BD779DRAFT_1608967 [Infundibulicybe gibba]|nr:hypothetical protein BD779DRAFT_1608967 [Infundibulicybe gibba]
MDFDTSWCPVCDRQIIPKRFQVPVPPPPPPAPAPPPSSPQSPPHKSQNTRRTKGGTIRQRGGGLVQGTGRVKPNGTIKRVDSASKPTQPAKPTGPIKHRTVIDQSPTPLYCSDKCRFEDINQNQSGLPIDFNPGRSSVASSLSVHPSEAGSDSTASSIESQSSTSSTTSQTHMSPSMATLAAMYNFPPLPPPAPIFPEDTSSSESDYPREYNSGIMMAARKIEAMCPKPAKRVSYGPYRAPPEPVKQIPGWNDGSNAWRASIYSFCAPPDHTNPTELESSTKAYKSFTASPHRTRGVYSTLGDSSASNSNLTTSLPSANSEMINKFSQSFKRRSESRASMYSASSTSRSFPATAPHRERSILEPGAEGRLLVPDVKLKVRNGSSASLSTTCSSPTTTSSRRSMPSPLSRYGSDSSDEDTQTQRCDSATSLPQLSKRPVVEMRSWSYDNLKTYPVMRPPPKMEKRIQKQIVDGVEVDVEVEVEIIEPLKRLFLFPSKEVIRR